MTALQATPHRVVPGMQRTTYTCYACHETRTYMVPIPAPEPADVSTPAEK
jgi:hypothetical protein